MGVYYESLWVFTFVYNDVMSNLSAGKHSY